MTVFAKEKFFSIEEYFILSEQSMEKLEYYDGKIKTMSGGTFNHAEISANIIYALKSALKKLKKKYRLCTSDMRIQIEVENRFLYPDAVVVFKNPEFYKNRKDTMTNPFLIVEVLSKGTKKRDLHEKFESYKTIPSFEQYVIISQDKTHVQTFLKSENWKSISFKKITDTIPLKSIGVEILMEDIFDDVEF